MVVAVLSVVGSVGASLVALFVDPLPADVVSPLLPLSLVGAPEPAGSPGTEPVELVPPVDPVEPVEPVPARPLAVRFR